MSKFCFCIIFLFTIVSFSQSKQFTISGTIIAGDDQTPLESATVYLERVKDTALVTYTITDKYGKFELNDETYDENLNLIVSYVGFQNHHKNIKMDKTEINLSAIELQVSNALDEVVIKSRAPITIKKDTLEFNVSSFKTKKDANVEDLLKQLPGVEVDEEGKITVNGKEVNKILVNGKPFFGNDPTITTKNLTKDIIEKIQIVDTKTKAEAYSGEEGDKDNKTINLTIKEENNKGVFGRVSAGGGTDERYEFAGMVNVFDNDQRISVLAGGNNTNSPGFSFGEISKMFGGGRNSSFSSNGSFSVDGRSFGGGQGITTSNNAGVNYADNIGEKTEASGDYFYSSSSSEDASSSQRETILSDSRYFSNSNRTSSNDTDSHSANLGFDVEIDSTFLININPSFRYSKSNTRTSTTDNSLNNESTLINESTSSSVVDNIGKNFNNEISMTKRFGTSGSFVRFNIENEISNSEKDDYLNSETTIYDTDQDPIVIAEQIIRDQYTSGDTKSNAFSTRVTYRLPIIAKELFIDFKYAYDKEKDENIESTYDFDEVSQDYNQFNTALSTDFEYVNEENKPGVRLVYKKEKWSTSFQTSYVFRTLENTDFLRPELSIKRDFKALELRYNFNYKFSAKASFYANYRLNNNSPSLRQLQPFQDVSNPLNTVTGNPNLEPSNRHRLYFGYNAFDFQKHTGFYIYGSANFNNNDVVRTTIIDQETLERNTTYANVNGNYNASFGFSYSKDVKLDSLRTIKFKAGTWGNMSKNVNFNNGIKYSSKVNSITPNIGFDFKWKKVFEFRPRYSLKFTQSSYDINAFNDRNYVNHSLDLRTSTFLPKRFEWRNDVKFTFNPDIADGFQKSAWFWNSTLAYAILKDQGAITLKVYDLLNQNTNARRVATQDYIEDSQSTVLQQYFMVSFSWKFNSLGSKGESKGGRMHYF
jgi:hypothetical protein